MTSRRRVGAVISVVHERHSARFTGPTKLLLDHTRRLGMPTQWTLGMPTQWTLGRTALMVPIQRAADLEASLIADGHRVEMRMVA
jgi:hypothetical protein